MKKYADVVRKLDDSKFKPLPEKEYCIKNNVQLHENLWGMFILKYTKDEMSKMSRIKLHSTFGCSGADYAWTPEVAEAFYEHPYHKKYIAKIKKRRGTWGWWCLQCEPSATDSY